MDDVSAPGKTEECPVKEPARPKVSSGEEVVDPDQVHLPDPIMNEIQRIHQRIHRLKRR